MNGLGTMIHLRYNHSYLQVVLDRDGFPISWEEFEDSDVAVAVNAFKNVRELIFNHSTKLTDRSLGLLQHLPHLQDVQLRGALRVTDQGLLLLAQAAPHLHNLALEIHGGQPDPRSKLPHIRGTNLQEVLSLLPELDRLTVNFSVSWKLLVPALQNTNIRSLQIGNFGQQRFDAGVGSEAVEVWTQAFSAMPNLQQITLSWMNPANAQTIMDGLNHGKPDLNTLILAQNQFAHRSRRNAS